MTRRIETIEVPDWSPPRGYANGMVARGRTLYVAGQIGWNAEQIFVDTDFIAQFAQALDNVIAVVSAAGGVASDIVSMTVYVTDVDAYRERAKELGSIWRARLGKHFPTMALVGVAALVEPQASVEIQAVAALGDAP